MSTKFRFLSFLGLLALAAPTTNASLIITGGSASWTIDEGLAAAISNFDAYFGDAVTRAQTLALPAPGTEPFTKAGNVVSLVDSIRPFGQVPLNDEGLPLPGVPGASRTRQATTLTVDPSNILGNWSTSNDAFAFVGNTTLGDQIAFTSIQRFTGPFTGSLVYGDFGLRYTGSKLVLTSNIDFLDAAFADIGNPQIDFSGNTLSISGDLLVGGGLSVLDPTAVLGTQFGSFSMVANVVPEPSSICLLAFSGLGVALYRRRR